MATTRLKSTFPTFLDLQGQPLEDGEIYIGTKNLNAETNQIAVYYDSSLTITASQPIVTSNGYAVRNGTPTNIFFDSDYSILVKDKNGIVVYTDLNVFEDTANEYQDNLFRIIDNVDITKKIAFEASTIASGMTRTITMPDEDITLGAVTFNDSTFKIYDDGDNTKQIAFQASAITTGTTRIITMPDEDITLGSSGLTGLKNLIVNANGLVNQRGYVSGTATTGANEVTVDRYEVIISGESLIFSTTANKTTFTAPAGGVKHTVIGTGFQSGTHVISFSGTATCTVDAVAKVSGDTFTLTGGTNAVIIFSNGTFELPQVEAGTTPTNFENRDKFFELPICKVDYQRLGSSSSASPKFQLYGIAGTAHVITYLMPVEMRSSPTVAKNGTWTATNCNQPTFTADGKNIQHIVTVTNTGIFASAPDTSDDYVEFFTGF